MNDRLPAHWSPAIVKALRALADADAHFDRLVAAGNGAPLSSAQTAQMAALGIAGVELALEAYAAEYALTVPACHDMVTGCVGPMSHKFREDWKTMCGTKRDYEALIDTLRPHLAIASASAS